MYKYVRKLSLFFLMAFSLTLPLVQTAAAQSADGPNDPAEFEAFLDAYLAEQMETHHIPGAVVSLVKDGKVFFTKGYGYADLENQIPFDPQQSVLTTASLGKAFTAVAVLQLADQGLIDINEDVRPYINHFELPDDYPGTLTFAHLLTHTDGFEARVIGGGAFAEEDLRPLEDILADYIPAQIASPGTAMTYGNFAANLAGYLVAEISGVPFEQYVADNILEPLGMQDSTFDQRLSPEMRARVVEAYEYQDGEHVQMPFFYINYAPEGGLRTTATDINQFMLALLNGGEFQGERILSEEGAQLMFTQQYAPAPKVAGITYGLFEHFEDGNRVLLRDGDGVGTRTRMIILPDQDMGLFISYNSGDSNLRLEIASAFLNHYYPVTGSETPIPMEGYQQRASQYAGTYRPVQADTTTFGKSMYFFSQLIEVGVTDEGYLSIATASLGDGDQSSSFGGFEGTSLWVEVEPLYFERVDGKGQLAFIEDDAGQITQMISGQGYHSPFVKLPWYESQSFHIILIELVVLFIISAIIATFIIWPLGTLIRKLRKQTDQTPVSWLAIAARIWVAVVGGMLALFVFRAIGVLYAIDTVGGLPNFAWGVSDEMISILNSIYLPVVLALPLPIFAVLAWAKSWWKMSTRVHYALVTVAIFAGIWWTHYWNLLGFRM